MKLIVAPAAAKALARMPQKEARALIEKLKAVAADPFGQHPWAKPLTGQAGYRVRQGDWRAVYRIDRAHDTVTVDAVAHRKEVYR